jgi:Bacterial regulatory proteins, lacI family
LYEIRSDVATHKGSSYDRAARIGDVAETASVSTATVSRALAFSDDFAP